MQFDLIEIWLLENNNLPHVAYNYELNDNLCNLEKTYNHEQAQQLSHVVKISFHYFLIENA